LDLQTDNASLYVHVYNQEGFGFNIFLSTFQNLKMKNLKETTDRNIGNVNQAIILHSSMKPEEEKLKP